MAEAYTPQDQDLIFALDIGTRSIIGIVGRAVDDRFEVLALDKEEHGKRAMMDGQIEEIDQVAQTVTRVTRRLEQAVGCHLTRVCIAAAGRALHTEKGRFQLELPGVRRITDDLVGQLEAGAVSAAEETLTRSGEGHSRFYLVGYTVIQYLLDRYPLSTLRGHNGQQLEAQVVATFLPAEVVDSLYAAMAQARLEVASLTLEPIAALNAAIPAELRLLNLVLADIGAGTTDIAVCREGSVVGYTMATIAGDEITEALMRTYLVDFRTAEHIKASMAGQTPIAFSDILGLPQEITPQQAGDACAAAAQSLAEALCRGVLDVNGAPPSALFLSGGGSKLEGLREHVAHCLEMDVQRVAVAGNNFHLSAFSGTYDLNDPEYATPLGIAVSCGLGLISDSYRVTLNDQPAKLFRSGTLSALDVLMMNGFGYGDLIGRTGRTLSVTVDGVRTLFRGAPATPSLLLVNGQEAAPSTIIHAGDLISFTPAQAGEAAQKTLEQLVGSRQAALRCLVNGHPAAPELLLQTGDVVQTDCLSPPIEMDSPSPLDGTGEHEPPLPAGETDPHLPPLSPPSAAAPVPILLFLNGRPLPLAGKKDGSPYLLMDLLEYSDIDFKHLDRPVTLAVNGADAPFTRELKDGDQIIIQYTGLPD